MKTKKNYSNRNHIKGKKKYVYTKKDYQSNDGMLTSVWGPGLWHTLHTMSFNYPISPSIEDKNSMFFKKRIQNAKFFDLNFIRDQNSPLPNTFPSL